MATPHRSWAAIASKHTASPKPKAAVISKDQGHHAAQVHEKVSSPPRIAFVSGHIDITPSQFSDNYSSLLDAAIRRGDAFIVSDARGTDTIALAYLRTYKVPLSRITIYLHKPTPPMKSPQLQTRMTDSNTRSTVEERFRTEGYNVKVISGYHADRDAAMTEASDYDILWVRGDAETAALFGSRYRPGRVSGTQKNKERRLLKARKAVHQS